MQPGRIGVVMDRSSGTDSRVRAFVAAALVLLVLPLIVMFGVIALGLATYAGIFAGFGDVFRGDASWPVLALFACWMFAVVVAVVAFALRLSRRSA